MNRLKERLARGEVVTMVLPRFSHPKMIEFLGKLGFGALFLDCEHGNMSIETVENLARAARVAGLPVVVRPEDNQRHLILRYLDVEGVDGILVSHVDTVEDAQSIVDAASYGRYKDASYRDAGMWRIEDKLIAAVIESPAGIKNLARMVQIEGIDLFFIGPHDLAQGMGYPGQLSHPDVMKALASATKTILDAGKFAGTLASYDTAHALIDSGITFLLTVDSTLLARGAAEFLALTTRDVSAGR